jgi:glutathione S-transferase
MYRLYGAPNSASFAPEAVLHEIGAAYDFVDVDLSKDKPRDPVYLKLNPHGRVPTLLDDGQIIFESAAISLYLADRHPEAGLVPSIDDPTRGQLYRWLFYLADSLQIAYLEQFYPERYLADPNHAPIIQARALDKIATCYGILDTALTRGPYFLGDQFSVADIYLLMLTTFHEDEARPVSAYGNVARCTEAAAERPATKSVLKRYI